MLMLKKNPRNLNVNRTNFFLLSSPPVVECSGLSSPVNGAVQMDDPMFSSMASYSCDQGFGLQGDATRTCQADGTWSGATPQCRSELILLLEGSCLRWVHTLNCSSY